MRIAKFEVSSKMRFSVFIYTNFCQFCQVQQKGEDDEVIARAIADKLGDTPGVSYSDIARKALECGRTDLAIRVNMY